MKNKIVLEISEALYGQLDRLSELTEESIESLAIQMIAAKLPDRIEKARRFQAEMEEITSDRLHGEIDFGEPAGREFV
ncbi:MAG: hypothetical protein J7647_14385 [Cyanobacteria bacterium SBLK]|nr:hypothetical protein [Cyanobacteria bacterium SBLK]